MAIEPQALGEIVGIVGPDAAVEGISEDRQPLVGELDPDLVLAAGERPDLKVDKAVVLRYHLDIAACIGRQLGPHDLAPVLPFTPRDVVVQSEESGWRILVR